MRRVLVVANQSLMADELHAAIIRRAQAGPCTFEIVVPATPLTDQQAALTHSEHLRTAHGETGSVALARWRLNAALQLLGEMGLEISGQIGHANPTKAASEAAERAPVDEVIVSTLARGRSRWLARGVPKRVHRTLGVRVEHVETGRVLGGTVEHSQHQPRRASAPHA